MAKKKTRKVIPFPAQPARPPIPSPVKTITVHFPAQGVGPLLDAATLAMFTVDTLADTAVEENNMDAMEEAGLRWSAVVALVDYILDVAIESQCLNRGQVRQFLPQLHHMTDPMLQCIDVATTRVPSSRKMVNDTLKAWGMKPLQKNRGTPPVVE